MAEKLIELVGVLNQEWDNLETELEKIGNVINLDTAVGASLDVCGSIVGETRITGDSDGYYRERIRRKIQLNSGHGDIETVIAACTHYTTATQVTILEYEAKIYAQLQGVTDISDDNIQRIKQYVAAGVGLFIIAVPFNPFQYDTAGRGYELGNYAYSIG